MNYYAYKGNNELGTEPLGTEGRHLLNYKRVSYVIRYLRSLGYDKFMVYTYSNFYDDNTFKLVYKQ